MKTSLLRAARFALRTLLVTVPSLGLTATVISAQSIADRVAKARSGTVRMSFAAQPDVCGNGTNSISRRSSGSTINIGNRGSSRDVEWEWDCDYGPVRVVLGLDEGEVISIRTYVGGRWRAPSATSTVTDLGDVSAKEAADYLVSLAAKGEGRVGRDAIFPATLADSAVIWPALLKIAKDDSRPRETRRQAVFWIGNAAGDKATENLSSLAVNDTIDREVREQVVFALSQRPKAEGIPALMKVARSSKDPELRKKAIFWLSQSNDPRALELFEELLTKR
jgi:hypothetical protein